MANNPIPINAAFTFLITTPAATKPKLKTKKEANRGVSLFHLPVTISWFTFLFLKIKMAAAEVLIPILSRNMVKDKILSTPFPKKVTTIAINANTVRPGTRAWFFGLR